MFSDLCWSASAATQTASRCGASGAERASLAERSRDIAELTGAALVELGSRTAARSRLLRSALAQAGTLRGYVPVDVTDGMIGATGAAPAAEHAGLDGHSSATWGCCRPRLG